MKRKIVNSLLLMAVSVSSVSTFVACKDYDEDVYVDLKNQISQEKTLREALQQQVDELNAFAHSLKQCECNLQQELADYLKKSEAEGLYLKKSELEGYLNEVAVRNLILEMLQAAQAEIDAKLGNYATKESVAEQMSEMNSAISSVKAIAEEALELAKAIKCECDLTEINGRLDKLDGLVAGWAEQIEAVTAKADKALTLAEKDSILIDANKKAIDELAAKVAGLPTDGGVDVTGILQRLDNLEKRYTNDEIDELIGALRSEKDILDSLTNEALERAKNDSIGILGLEARVGDLEECLDEIVKTLPELQDQITAVDERVDALTAEVERIDAEVDKLKADIQNMITGITVQAAESPVVGYLNTPFGLSANILAVYYGTPEKDWTFPEWKHSGNYLTENSGLGMWTPRNLDAIGGSFEDVEGYVSGPAGVTLLTQDGWDGNAGTLYVTVNPSNVDFTGQTLKLVDSQDEDAPVMLSPLQRSDRTLGFGYTRAADNGFYEAAATIHDVEEAKMNVDFNAIGDDVKDLLKDRTKSDVLQLASTLMNSVENVLPAYGVMASWTDKSSNQKHNIYSQYNIAATAIQPLSLTFMSDWQGVSSMPTLDRLQDLIGGIVDKIDLNQILDLPDFSKYEDFEIEFGNVQLDGDKLKVKIKLSNDGDVFIPVASVNGTGIALVKIGEEGNVAAIYVEQQDGTYTLLDPAQWAANGYDSQKIQEAIDSFLEIDLSAQMKSTIDQVMESLGGDINGTLKDLFNDIASIGKLNGSVGDVKEDIKSAVNGYISRINNKLTKWFNRAPGLLHLTMIANEGNKAGLLSQSKALPTKVSTTTLKLIPTTYSLELLAPTYKKFVAVTDVFYNSNGNNAPISIAQAANSNPDSYLGKVVEGNVICTLNGRRGYTYEVTYTAIDYFGKVAIRKYYVKF